MRLIIGLGNPGEKYERTRHNAGFLFLDALREKWEAPEFVPEKKFSCSVSVVMGGGDKTILVKPETYMNRSGESVSAIMKFFKLSPADIVVIHDDIDLPIGTWKDATGSRAAGHNGVADIIGKLGTKDFRRIRIGIGRPPENATAEDYVLDRFGPDEEARLPEIFGEILSTFQKVT